MGEAGEFTSIPTLDYELLSTNRKEEFIASLRNAVVNIGFLYLKNPPVDKAIISALIEYIPRLFDLPQEKKDKIAMANSEHFLGYSKLGKELTKGAVDQREQFDFANKWDGKGWTPGDPEYLRLFGEAQWPEERDLPGFRDVMERYLSQVAQLSYTFASLLAEALGLTPNGLDAFFDEPGHPLQHRSKIVKYRSLPEDEHASDQGVGPHYDAGFLTLLLQASPHAGLQVQTPSGAWVDAPPLPDTLVVNFGKGIESATKGLAKATSHRVLSPPPGSTPRYSVPFFQRIRQGIRLTEHIPNFPDEILKLLEERGGNGPTDSINYAEYEQEPSGKVELIGRVKSHPDVAARHYPDLFKQYFPNGLPARVDVY